MAVADFNHGGRSSCDAGLAGARRSIYTLCDIADPIHAIDFEFLTDQIVDIAHDHPICFGIEIDNITRPRRSAWKSFALADGEKLDAGVLGNEVPIDIVNLTPMKFVFAQM